MAQSALKTELSPGMTTAIIVVVLLIVGLVIWRLTAVPNKVLQLPPDAPLPGSKGIVGPGHPGPLPGEKWNPPGTSKYRMSGGDESGQK